MTFENLQVLGMGIIGFAIIIGVGTVVLQNLGGAVGNCPTVATVTSSWNSSAGECYFTNGSAGGDPSGTAWTNLNYMETQLGSTGLAGWTPAVVAISVGMLFLGYFMMRKGKAGRTY